MPRCFRSWLAWLLPAIALIWPCSAHAAGAPRLALVIGNAAYPARPLATTANDAALVAQALAQAGFDVTAARDLDAVRLRAALAAFVDAARAAGPEATLFVYLAGYGVQYTGGNFFVPVDARLVHDDDVPAETASLDELARALADVPAKARLIVADASRAHLFATADEMPLAPGLGLTIAPKDTIVAFAAAPDMVAPDDALPYGAYARALAETIAAPGVSPNALFDRVRLRVGMLTNGEQVPWDDGVIADDVALTPAVGTLPPPPPLPQPPGGGLSADTAYCVVMARDTLASYAEFLRVAPDGPLAGRIRVLQAVRREATMWQSVAASDDPRAAWTYMRRYPRAPHRFDARRRLAALHAALEPPPRFDPFLFPALPPPTAAELPLVAAPEAALRGLPPIPVPPAALLPPADPAYYEELPMPAPAPAGLLPIAPPLPGAAGGEPGRIAQARPGGGLAVSETQLAPNGSASVTLADTAGPILELVAADATGDARTLTETGPEPAATGPAKTEAGKGELATTAKGGGPNPKPGAKPEPPVLSRTVVLRTAEGVTTTQVGADGAALFEVTTRADVDGGHTTRVTDGRGALLASWRRDAQGVVVARDAAPLAPAARTEPVPQTPPAALPPARAVTVAPAEPLPAHAAVPQAPPAPAAASPLPTPAPPPPSQAVSPVPPAPTSPPSPPSASPPARAEPAPAPPAAPTPSAAPLPPRRPAAVSQKPPTASRKSSRSATAPKATAKKSAPARKTPSPHRPAPRHGRR